MKETYHMQHLRLAPWRNCSGGGYSKDYNNNISCSEFTEQLLEIFAYFFGCKVRFTNRSSIRW